MISHSPTSVHSPTRSLTCPTCGVSDAPLIAPGNGPHAFRATCRHCGAFLRWLSRYAPDEQAARREQQRQSAMAVRPPSVAQMQYLSALGCSAPMSSMLSASIAISAILQAWQGGAR